MGTCCAESQIMMKAVVLTSALHGQQASDLEFDKTVKKATSSPAITKGPSVEVMQITDEIRAQEPAISKIQAMIRGRHVRRRMKLSKEDGNVLWYAKIKPVISQVCALGIVCAVAA